MARTVKTVRNRMDPDACLKEALELAEIILEKWECPEESFSEYNPWDDAVALAESVQALNGWLSRGGFKPKGWK